MSCLRVAQVDSDPVLKYTKKLLYYICLAKRSKAPPVAYIVKVSIIYRAIHHGPVVSMDTSVRMHSTSHLDYGLLIGFI